jgi:hypothetical protein
MEAPSLPLLKTLLSSYNKLRKLKHTTSPKLTKQQLLLLCAALEKHLDEGAASNISDATKSRAMQYMSCLLVAFLTFLLPQRSQVRSLRVSYCLVMQLSYVFLFLFLCVLGTTVPDD